MASKISEKIEELREKGRFSKLFPFYKDYTWVRKVAEEQNVAAPTIYRYLRELGFYSSKKKYNKDYIEFGGRQEGTEWPFRFKQTVLIEVLKTSDFGLSPSRREEKILHDFLKGMGDYLREGESWEEAIFRLIALIVGYLEPAVEAREDERDEDLYSLVNKVTEIHEGVEGFRNLMKLGQAIGVCEFRGHMDSYLDEPARKIINHLFVRLMEERGLSQHIQIAPEPERPQIRSERFRAGDLENVGYDDSENVLKLIGFDVKGKWFMEEHPVKEDLKDSDKLSPYKRGFLTPQELSLLRTFGKGEDMEEIAEELEVSVEEALEIEKKLQEKGNRTLKTLRILANHGLVPEKVAEKGFEISFEDLIS